MDALLMCGGQGIRFGTSAEKSLYEIGNQPMIGRVLAGLRASQIEAVHAVTSPHAPETKRYLERRAVNTIHTNGEGYVTDLNRALDQVETPVLTVAADLPLIDGEVIDCILRGYPGGSLTVCIQVSLKDLLGLSVEMTVVDDARELAPTGINIVSDEEEENTLVTFDARLAVNVNRRSDARIAERLL